MQQQEPLNTPYTGEELQEVDVRQLVSMFFANWHWFALSVLLFMVLGFYYLKTRAPIYESKSSVLIKQDESAPEEMLLFEGMGFSMGQNNIDNEIGVFKSPDLITRIVSSMELYTIYSRESQFGFYSPELYHNSPLYVRMEDVEPELIPGTFTFRFIPDGDDLWIEPAHNKQKLKRIKLSNHDLPGYFDLPMGRFYVTRQPEVDFGSEPLVVTIENARRVTRRYIKDLKIGTATKNASLLEIALYTENKKRGEEFLQALIAEYNRDAVKDKNTVAYNTSVFIDERLKDIALELGEVEERVETFRKKHDVADINTQVGSYIRQTESYDERKMDIETQLNLVRFIENFLLNPANKNKLVPNLGLKDPGLIAIITEYNALLIDKERIESATSAINPTLQKITQQVENMHENIIASISNERQASEIALANLEREHTITSSKISNFPTVDREYTDILRQQEVKSNLFIFLLQKREEVNLTQAAVAPKAKLIARPYTGEQPVAPKRMLILLGFFIVGFSIPGVSLYLRNYFQTKIEGMSELEKLRHAAVVGDIIKSDELSRKNELVVKPNDDSVVNEMFRTLRNNLLFMLSGKENKIVLVTSTIAKEGKTFISANLARSLSLMDKKVLLLGADLRSPQISKVLNVPNPKVGFSAWLSGQADDVAELIEVIYPNFSILQAGAIPPNPNELLSSSRTGELLEKLSKDFDYVIIDSAPVGVVSDTFLLARYAHATLYVVREGFSEKDTLSFINNITRDKRLNNVGVVLNFASMHKNNGKYRYGHGYGYGAEVKR